MTTLQEAIAASLNEGRSGSYIVVQKTQNYDPHVWMYDSAEDLIEDYLGAESEPNLSDAIRKLKPEKPLFYSRSINGMKVDELYILTNWK